MRHGFRRLGPLIVVLCWVGLAPAQNTMLVVQKGDDSAGLFDSTTGKALGQIHVGVKPHEIVLSEDGKLAYVTLYGVDRYTETVPGGASIAIVDLIGRRKLGEIDLKPFRRPHGIARGASGKLYVTCDFPPTLLVIDPALHKIEKSVDIAQVLPHMVVVTADEKKAYVSNSGSGTVSAVALNEAKVIKQIEIGGVPMGVALGPDGRKVYAANRNGDAVVVIDTTSDEVVGRRELPGNPGRVRLLPEGDRLLVSLIETGAVVVLDLESMRTLHKIPIGHHAEGLGIDPSGLFAYASAQDDAKVVKFSLANGTPVLEIRTGKRPDPIVILSRP